MFLRPKLPSRRPLPSPTPRALQRYVCLSSNNNVLLTKKMFEFASVLPPPCMIEDLHHDLNNDDVVALHCVPGLPKAFSWGSCIRGQPSKTVGQFPSNVVKIFHRKSTAIIRINWKKQLDDIWHGQL